jgi:hypothetical protein
MKSFENIELMDPRTTPPQAGAGAGVAGDVSRGLGQSVGDVAQQRRGTADQLRQIGEKIAAGDVDSAMRLVQQIIAIEATAADQNFRAQLQLETVQGSIGNMLKIFGTMIKAFGGEELGQQLIDMADDPNLRLDRVNPDTSRVEGLDTNMDPSLQGHTREIINSSGAAARGQAAETPRDTVTQGDGAYAAPTDTPRTGDAPAPPAGSSRETRSVASGEAGPSPISETRLVAEYRRQNPGKSEAEARSTLHLNDRGDTLSQAEIYSVGRIAPDVARAMGLPVPAPTP